MCTIQCKTIAIGDCQGFAGKDPIADKMQSSGFNFKKGKAQKIQKAKTCKKKIQINPKNTEDQSPKVQKQARQKHRTEEARQRRNTKI